MKNQITGRVIGFSELISTPSSDPEKSYTKRSIVIDCTRYDPNTGQPGFKNTPMFTFSGKYLQSLNSLIAGGLKKDDQVIISFSVKGRPYTDKNGKNQIFTFADPYEIALDPAQDRGMQAPPEAPSPTQPESEQNTNDDLPF